ncbi:MAG TPA: PKD domain-containing protein [Bacteroidia bacterium]|nr:PKD domain-containing protein [Bacteroidia bacterium]
MKHNFFSQIFKMLVAVIFFYGTTANASAQNCTDAPNCIANPTMIASQGGDLNAGGTTMNDWWRSHGSPSVGIGSGATGSNSIWMWSYESKGEGVFSCYNFQQGVDYRICFWVKNTGTLNLGNLNVKAATGLTQGSSTAIPTPATSQNIHTSWGYNTTWTQVVVDYTPDANYNQLWFYPFWSGISADHGYRQYELVISDVYVFEKPLGVGFGIPCGGDINLAGHGAPCVTTSWYGPNGAYLGTGSVNIPNADPSMNGIYTAVYTVGDCEYRLEYQVMVEECNCDEFEAAFEWDDANPKNFYEGSSGPGTSVGWFWEFGDGGTSNLQNPTHAYANAGEYEVCLTVIRKVGNQTCCKRTCNWVYVDRGTGGGDDGEGGGHPNGKVGFNTTGINIANGVKFNDATAAPSPVNEYEWNFGDGTTSGQQNPAHVYAQPGTYTVCLEVKSFIYDANGAVVEETVKEYCREVTVNNNPVLNSEISVTPNPAAEQAMVVVKNMVNPKVVLRNMAGVAVAAGLVVEEGRFILQLQSIPSGMYIVEVQSDNGTRTTKLVKQ